MQGACPGYGPNNPDLYDRLTRTTNRQDRRRLTAANNASRGSNRREPDRPNGPIQLSDRACPGEVDGRDIATSLGLAGHGQQRLPRSRPFWNVKGKSVVSWD